jgi:hypothetical protein
MQIWPSIALGIVLHLKVKLYSIYVSADIHLLFFAIGWSTAFSVDIVHSFVYSSIFIISDVLALRNARNNVMLVDNAVMVQKCCSSVIFPERSSIMVCLQS